MKLKRLIFLVAVLFLLSITMADALTVSGTKHNETDVKAKYDWRYSTGTTWYRSIYQIFDLARVKNYSVFTPFRYPFYDSESGICDPYSAEYNFSDYGASLKLGHNPSEIWVSVNGREDTLLNSLKYFVEENGGSGLLAGLGLCGTSSVPYSNIPANFVGHLASEVEVNISGNMKSLQQAIDNGDFCKKCGDGICNMNEDCKSCPSDCGNLREYRYGNKGYYCNTDGCLKLYIGGYSLGHTQEQCLNSNGKIIMSSGTLKKIPNCEFASQSCPVGWLYYNPAAGGVPETVDICGRFTAGIIYGAQAACAGYDMTNALECLPLSFNYWSEGGYCSSGSPYSRTTTLCY